MISPAFLQAMVRPRLAAGDRGITVAPPTAIQSVANVVAILRDELAHVDREKLICLMLNARHILIGLEVVSVRNVDRIPGSSARDIQSWNSPRTRQGSFSLKTIPRAMRPPAMSTFGSRSVSPNRAVCSESTYLTTHPGRTGRLQLQFKTAGQMR